jgi:hypothetical protein
MEKRYSPVLSQKEDINKNVHTYVEAVCKPFYQATYQNEQKNYLP